MPNWASLKANLTPPMTVDLEFDRPFLSGEQVLYRDPEIDIHCFDSQYQRYCLSETVTSAIPLAMIEISSWVAEIPAAAPLCLTHWKSSRRYTINGFESVDSDPIDLYIDYLEDVPRGRLYAVFLRSFDNRGNRHPQATSMLVGPADEDGTMKKYQRVGIVQASYDDRRGHDFVSIVNSISPGCTVMIGQDVDGASEGTCGEEGSDGMIIWQRRTLRLI